MKKIFLLISVLFPVILSAQDYSVKLQPPDSKFKEVEYFMWIPENVKTIKGIIVHQHGCGETAYKSGRNAFHDVQWRALAKKWDFALMGSSYTSRTDCFNWIHPEEGSYNAFINGIAEIAKQSDHKELENVPWVIWGHSGGGHWAYDMVLQHPERIICAVLKSPAWSDTSSMGLQVPLLCLLGMRESINTFSSFVYSTAVEAMKFRISKNAPVCIAPDPSSGHESANTRLLAIPFIDEILKLRLTDSTVGINRSKEYFIDLENFNLTGNKTDITYANNLTWFPDKIFAEKWLEFINTGNVSDTSPPEKPPYSVTLKREGSKIIINWQADADPGSGIREFRIYRNGKLLNQGHDNSNWNFSIDYHDNPIEIYDKFEFADSTVNIKKKYSYQISIVNNAGLESAKSMAVFD
ncbi:MAG: alpha/beta hydrolase [Bacteroidales bacterium]|nr:alpha/beta hydrolase [Bacteroidales bacterium]